jgi:hypothetical protein
MVMAQKLSFAHDTGTELRGQVGAVVLAGQLRVIVLNFGIKVCQATLANLIPRRAWYMEEAVGISVIEHF